MNFYYAPMEGITLYPLRNIHREIFGKGVDKYFTPFLTATHTHHFKNREKKDILPDKNPAFDGCTDRIIPQIMAGCAEDFLWAAGEIKKLGYNEVNLNLGCPAPTVVNRRKGAGLLIDTDYLDEMLKKIFDAVPAADPEAFVSNDGSDMISENKYPYVSIKSRLGFSSPDEAKRLMEIFAAYPIKELILHARVREDYYAGSPRLDDFKNAAYIYRQCGGTADICYNGSIDTPDDYKKILGYINSDQPVNSKANRPLLSSVMIGRGLLADPALVRELGGGSALTGNELRLYLRKLYDSYSEYIPEDRNVIFKMLEHWAFLHVHFRDCERCLKAIRKARSKGEYSAAVNNIFSSCEFIR